MSSDDTEKKGSGERRALGVKRIDVDGAEKSGMGTDRRGRGIGGPAAEKSLLEGLKGGNAGGAGRVDCSVPEAAKSL